MWTLAKRNHGHPFSVALWEVQSLRKPGLCDKMTFGGVAIGTVANINCELLFD